MLAGRTAPVTGASRGAGRACALLLAKAGAQVVGAARRTGLIDGLSAEAVAAGALPIDSRASDMTERDAPDPRAALVAERLNGTADILVNAGGGSRPVTITGTSEPQFLSFATPAKAALRAWGVSLAVAKAGVTLVASSRAASAASSPLIEACRQRLDRQRGSQFTLTTQRNPRCDVAVSTVWGQRAAGR